MNRMYVKHVLVLFLISPLSYLSSNLNWVYIKVRLTFRPSTCLSICTCNAVLTSLYCCCQRITIVNVKLSQWFTVYNCVLMLTNVLEMTSTHLYARGIGSRCSTDTEGNLSGADKYPDKGSLKTLKSDSPRLQPQFRAYRRPFFQCLLTEASHLTFLHRLIRWKVWGT